MSVRLSRIFSKVNAVRGLHTPLPFCPKAEAVVRISFKKVQAYFQLFNTRNIFAAGSEKDTPYHEFNLTCRRD